MATKSHPDLAISEDILEAIRSFPVQREIEHCGARHLISSFDLYTDCSHCGARIKARSYSANLEIEDVFDAVFEWMNRPMAQEAASRRRSALGDGE